MLLGNGDGTFQAALDTPVELFQSIYYRNVYSGDFNGDGKLDLLVLGAEDLTTGHLPWSVLLGNGNGTFSAPAQVNSTYPVIGLAVGDFNGDKKLDLVFVNGGLQEMLGNGDGTFQPTQVVSQIGGIVVSGDFNGDGKLDLVLASGSDLDPSQVLLGNGDGTFRPPSAQNLPGTLFPVDLNHDGRTDFITESSHLFIVHCGFVDVPRFTFSVDAHVANSDGTFQSGQQIAHGGGHSCQITGGSINVGGVADYDGDGNVDVVAGAFYSGHGDGTFESSPVAISGFPGLPAADLNGDKLADGVEILTSSTIGVVLNTTQGFWLGAPVSLSPVRAGGPTTAMVSVNPQNGFIGDVSITCSAPQSLGVQCSFSPSTVAPGASSTLTVSTTGNSASSQFPKAPSHWGWLYALYLPLAMAVCGRLGLISRQRVTSAVGPVLVVAMLFLAACGGGSSLPNHNTGTPPGTYLIRVTAVAGTISRSTTVHLTVQ